MAGTSSGTVESLKNLFENRLASRKNKEYLNNGNTLNGKKSDPPLNSEHIIASNVHNNLSAPIRIQSTVNGCIESGVPHNNNNNRNPPPPKPKPKPHIIHRVSEELDEAIDISSSSNFHAIHAKPKIKTTNVAEYGARSNAADLSSTDKPAIAQIQTKTFKKSNSSSLPKNNTSLNNTPVHSSGITFDSQSLIYQKPVPSKDLKKPPPIPKKPRSVMSCSSLSDSKPIVLKYDQELNEKFGIKKDNSDYITSWADLQAQCQREHAATKAKQKASIGINLESGNTSLSEFATSSIRSILKKQNSRGSRKKKNISFKDDLVTKLYYHSEDSINSDTGSLDSLYIDQLSLSDSDQDSDSDRIPTRRTPLPRPENHTMPPFKNLDAHENSSEENTVRSSSTMRPSLPYTYDTNVTRGSPEIVLGSSARNFGNPFKRFVPSANGIRFHY